MRDTFFAVICCFFISLLCVLTHAQNHSIQLSTSPPHTKFASKYISVDFQGTITTYVDSDYATSTFFSFSNYSSTNYSLHYTTLSAFTRTNLDPAHPDQNIVWDDEVFYPNGESSIPIPARIQYPSNTTLYIFGTFEFIASTPVGQIDDFFLQMTYGWHVNETTDKTSTIDIHAGSFGTWLPQSSTQYLQRARDDFSTLTFTSNVIPIQVSSISLTTQHVLLSRISETTTCTINGGQTSLTQPSPQVIAINYVPEMQDVSIPQNHTLILRCKNFELLYFGENAHFTNDFVVTYYAEKPEDDNVFAVQSISQRFNVPPMIDVSIANFMPTISPAALFTGRLPPFATLRDSGVLTSPLDTSMISASNSSLLLPFRTLLCEFDISIDPSVNTTTLNEGLFTLLLQGIYGNVSNAYVQLSAPQSINFPLHTTLFAENLPSPASSDAYGQINYSGQLNVTAGVYIAVQHVLNLRYVFQFASRTVTQEELPECVLSFNPHDISIPIEFAALSNVPGINLYSSIKPSSTVVTAAAAAAAAAAGTVTGTVAQAKQQRFDLPYQQQQQHRSRLPALFPDRGVAGDLFAQAATVTSKSQLDAVYLQPTPEITLFVDPTDTEARKLQRPYRYALELPLGKLSASFNVTILQLSDHFQFAGEKYCHIIEYTLTNSSTSNNDASLSDDSTIISRTRVDALNVYSSQPLTATNRIDRVGFSYPFVAQHNYTIDCSKSLYIQEDSYFLTDSSSLTVSSSPSLDEESTISSSQYPNGARLLLIGNSFPLDPSQSIFRSHRHYYIADFDLDFTQVLPPNDFIFWLIICILFVGVFIAFGFALYARTRQNSAHSAQMLLLEEQEYKLVHNIQ